MGLKDSGVGLELATPMVDSRYYHTLQKTIELTHVTLSDMVISRMSLIIARMRTEQYEAPHVSKKFREFSLP